MSSHDIERLTAAIQVIHDHLHADRVNEAHAACECTIDGGTPDPKNITVRDAAEVQNFIVAFNKLCLQQGARAATVVLIPSATDPRKVSLQIGGNVQVCQIIENMMKLPRSKYMGDH